jgi:Zn finger protein HypA/HybF involved in hydrogenase expression
MNMSILNNLEKEDLIDIILNSNSFKEVVEKVGYNSNGSGGYDMVKMKLKEMGIDIPKYKKRGGGLINKKCLSEILVENSNYKNRTRLKKRLINEGILEYKCNCCGINEWLGKPISLQLEHKNGINNDNRIQNIELLCPNCHSQTSTYAGKNIGKIKDSTLEVPFVKKCPKCDSEIHRQSKLCKKCFNLKQRKIKRPKLETLLDEVEKNGYSSTGRKYGVSDNTIRNWIRVHQSN